MFDHFLYFVLTCWEMVIYILENTDLGRFNYMQVIVAIGVVSLIVRIVIVNMEK